MKTKTDIISLDNQTSNLYKVTLSGREFTAVGVTDDHVNNNVPTPDDNTPQVESYNMNVASSVNEGQDLPVTITTGNVANGTKLYWTVTNTGNGDFVAETGDFTINNDTSSFNITPILDFTTEGPEGFYIRIRTNSVTGNEVATSPLITINDTSSTPTPPVPTYSIVSTATNINEAVKQLADLASYSQDNTPAASGGSSVSEGNIWYDTDDDQIKIYRETSTGNFEWVPIIVGAAGDDSDTLDAGAF